MASRTPSWKENKIISIETRKDTFVLAQMLKNPFLRFYNEFSNEPNDWKVDDLKNSEVLFATAVTSQFLKHSNVAEIKNISPETEKIDTDRWIHQFTGSRYVSVWKGTEQEKTFIILGAKAGGSLVKKDLWWTPTDEQSVRSHISGVIDEMILDEIPLDDTKTIDSHELTNLGVFPILNERLYLCQLLKKNVDPYKDLIFDRVIPKEYNLVIEIISGGGSEENRNKILDKYFR